MWAVRYSCHKTTLSPNWLWSHTGQQSSQAEAAYFSRGRKWWGSILLIVHQAAPWELSRLNIKMCYLFETTNNTFNFIWLTLSHWKSPMIYRFIHQSAFHTCITLHLKSSAVVFCETRGHILHVQVMDNLCSLLSKHMQNYGSSEWLYSCFSFPRYHQKFMWLSPNNDGCFCEVMRLFIPSSEEDIISFLEITRWLYYFFLMIFFR